MAFPIVQTSTYLFTDTADLIAFKEGRGTSCEYGRLGNPTQRACEEKIRDLEGAQDCLVTASGMSAATTVRRGLYRPSRFAPWMQPPGGATLAAVCCTALNPGVRPTGASATLLCLTSLPTRPA